MCSGRADGHRDVVCLIAALQQLRQDNRQLAVVNSGARTREIERSVEPDCAGEAAKLPLHMVKGLIFGRPRWCFFAGDQEHARAKDHTESVRGDAADIHHDFNRFVRLEHVERRVAFTRRCAKLVRKSRCQILEQLPDIVRELARFTRGNEGELLH